MSIRVFTTVWQTGNRLRFRWQFLFQSIQQSVNC